jgi:hypothetical protein
LILCSCATKTISIVDDLCTRHKSGYDTYSKTLRADGAHHLPASEWIVHRLQAEIEHPAFYAELDRQESEPKSEWGGYIEKMRAGLAAAVLAIDHLLGPNWFRADPDHVAAVQGCLDGLDAHQILTSMGIFPPPKRVLNFVTQRVKLDGYLGDGITDICGCTEVVEDGHQLCPFHRQHYFAYRQKADPATMLRVQQWTQKRRSAISVWATKGALR